MAQASHIGNHSNRFSTHRHEMKKTTADSFRLQVTYFPTQSDAGFKADVNLDIPSFRWNHGIKAPQSFSESKHSKSVQKDIYHLGGMIGT
jgi:hypothetical protein